jgi:hypothetical protein
MASASMCSCAFLAVGAPGRARLDALCLRLYAVGGASAARTLTHALDRLLRLQDEEGGGGTSEHRNEEGEGGEGTGAAVPAAAADDGRDLAGAFSEAAAAANDDGRDGAAFISVAAAARVVVDVAWEKLHTGDWKDVDVAWRELYVLGAMLRVSAELQLAEVTLTPAEALKALDMAALLGGPGAFRDELEGAIARVQAAVTRELDDGERRRRRGKRPRGGECAEDEAAAFGAEDEDGEGDGEREEGSWRLGGDGDGGDGDESGGDGGCFQSGGTSVLPPGSLAAAGAHSGLRGPVPHLASPPSLEAFYCNHMLAGAGGCGAPVVIAGAMVGLYKLKRSDP